MKIGYARVSTEDQKTDLQIDALKAYGCEVIYQDVGESGRKASRPEFDRMLASLKRGDIVVVWNMDRLGRDVYNLIVLDKDLTKRGISLKTLTGMEIDTSTPEGEFNFNLYAALAQFESRRHGRRVKSGIAARTSRGKKWNECKIIPDGQPMSPTTLWRRARSARLQRT